MSVRPLCMLSSYGRVRMLPSGEDVSLCPRSMRVRCVRTGGRGREGHGMGAGGGCRPQRVDFTGASSAEQLNKIFRIFFGHLSHRPPPAAAPTRGSLRDHPSKLLVSQSQSRWPLHSIAGAPRTSLSKRDRKPAARSSSARIVTGTGGQGYSRDLGAPRRRR